MIKEEMLAQAEALASGIELLQYNRSLRRRTAELLLELATALRAAPARCELVAWEDIAERLCAVDGNGFLHEASDNQRAIYKLRAMAVASLYASPARCDAQSVRSAVIEECAKIAERYADNPCSFPHNNTLEAFHRGLNHEAGCMDSADCITQAIRALSTPSDDFKESKSP